MVIAIHCFQNCQVIFRSFSSHAWAILENLKRSLFVPTGLELTGFFFLCLFTDFVCALESNWCSYYHFMQASVITKSQLDAAKSLAKVSSQRLLPV